MVSDRRDDKTQSFVPLVKGTLVSHYEIIKKIGAGGMGEVYLAEDTKLHRRVALKFLPPYLVADKDARTRFTREAEAAAGLRHPNIVTIYEVGEFKGRPFFAMEHVEGHSLHFLAHERPLPFDEVIELAIQICEGLNKAHQAGIIHRDIKPSNIIVDDDGRPRILDFGLATVRGEEKLTKTGSTLGTIAYMSPEQARGREVDQRSDLFSLGIVLYELIAGRTPFRRDSEAATLQAILQDTPEPLARYKADVPPGIQRIIDKSLDKDVETRYQTAAGLLAELKREKKISVSQETVPGIQKTAATPSRKNLRRVLIPTSALVLIVLLFLILKPWKIVVEPTQEAVAKENRLAIMYFDNLADPEDSLRLGEIAANLLITDLSESQYLDVVSSQRLYDILKLIGREGEKKIGRDVATEVAVKARCRRMLLGSILQVVPHIVITSQLVDVETGSAVASQRITGAVEDNIFTLVDRLTVELKNDLALPIAAREEPDRPVAEVTTHSPEAYRYYLMGLESGYKFYRAEAARSLEKALELDSTFAMAYYRLAGLKSGLERKQLTAKAMEYSDRASWKEKHLIRSWNSYISGNHLQAITDLQKIIDRYPEDKEGWFSIGLVYYRGLRQVEDAIYNYNRAIELDSLNKFVYNQLAYAYNQAGDFEKSIWAINKYISLAPDEANPYDSRGELYAANGKLEQAIASFKKAVEIKPDFYMSWESLGQMFLFKEEYTAARKCFEKLLSSTERNTRSSGRSDLALIPLGQGKFNEALAILDQGIAAGRMEQVQEWGKRMLMAMIFTEQGNLQQGIDAVELAFEDYQERRPDRPVPFRAFYIQLLTENGQQTKAEEAAKNWKQEIEEKEPSMMDYYWIGAGVLEFEKENYEAAAGHFARAAEGITDRLAPVGFRVYFMLARAYQEAGRLGEAVAEYEKLLANYSQGRAAWSISAVKAHYYLGMAYEKSGWTGKAIERYEEFLEIWKNADSGIESVEDAKARLIQLKKKT